MPHSQAHPEYEYVYVRRVWYLFYVKHDVIEIGLKQKGNVLCVVQPTMPSTLGVYDIQPLIARYM